MRYAPRGSAQAPSALSAKDKKGNTELDRVRAHIANADPNKKAFNFQAYKADDVRQQLDALFHGKCAYCETYYASSAPVDIEHFRPKGAVSEDSSHPGYWWLAMVWENLLPSCIDCNRQRGQQLYDISTSLAQLRRSSTPLLSSQSGKKDSFPLADNTLRLQPENGNVAGESALLINPCETDPQAHLAFVTVGSPPVSLVLPRSNPGISQQGATSIQIYGLNRLGLVQERSRVLRRLAYLGELVLELGELIDRLDDPAVKAVLATTPAAGVASKLSLLMEQTAAEMRSMTEPEQPFSAMAAEWLQAFSQGAV